MTYLVSLALVLDGHAGLTNQLTGLDTVCSKSTRSGPAREEDRQEGAGSWGHQRARGSGRGVPGYLGLKHTTAAERRLPRGPARRAVVQERIQTPHSHLSLTSDLLLRWQLPSSLPHCL